jgi:GGDEF domain-containing protein
LADNLNQGYDFAVLYIDLDNFKAFNDHYGFEHGDRAITLLAEIIAQAAGEFGGEDDLVGHIGGDDFVIITHPDRHLILANKIIELFDRLIVDLYDRQAVEEGFIIAHNRKGEKIRIPIMGVSIAGVFNENRSFHSHLQLGEAAAEVKKVAKAHAGSYYYYDQRKVH